MPYFLDCGRHSLVFSGRYVVFSNFQVIVTLNFNVIFIYENNLKTAKPHHEGPTSYVTDK